MKRLLAGIMCLFAIACGMAEAAPRKPTQQAAPSFSIADVSVSEEAGQVTLTITKSGSSRSGSTVIAATAPGTAHSGIDYNTRTQTITFAKSQTRATFVVNLVNDAVPEGTEQFTVSMTAGSNARIARSPATVTIADSDNESVPMQTCPNGQVIPQSDTCPPLIPDPGPEPTPDPNPTPPPTGAAGVASEGDSISVSWAGSHTGMYKSLHGSTHFCGLAIGGSVIGVPTDGNALTNPTRIAAVDACNAKVVTVLIGANDLISWNPEFTATTWLNRLWGYTDALRAKGYKVLVGTVLPQYQPNSPVTNYTALFNARRRNEVNPAIRAAVGVHHDGVIDFAADPVMGVDAAPQNTSLYYDGLHPTDSCGVGCGGQGKLYPIYAAAVDKALADSPAPPPTTGSDPTGLTAIPTTDFDVNTALTPTWGTGEIPVSNAPDIVGAFRFICGAGQLLYDDPVVYPGQKGKSHLHQFYGNMNANFGSTFASLRGSGDSTCNSTNKMLGTGKAANRSGYWIPAMLDGKGNVVQPDYVQAYYKGRPDTNIECQSITKRATGAGICINIPNGLRFINGYDMIAQTAATGFDRPQFHCEGPGASGVTSYSIPAAKANGCPAGSRLAVTMQSKLCWDGVNLDSTDHRSHMADMVRDNDAGTSGCPSSHPYWIPQVTLSFFYSVEAGDDLDLWEPSSDAHARMANPSLLHGQSFHFDYFEAWDVTVKAMWFDNCINKLLNGSGGDLCNGKQLKGASVPYYNGVANWKNPNRLVPIPVNQ